MVLVLSEKKILDGKNLKKTVNLITLFYQKQTFQKQVYRWNKTNYIIVSVEFNARFGNNVAVSYTHLTVETFEIFILNTMLR